MLSEGQERSPGFIARTFTIPQYEYTILSLNSPTETAIAKVLATVSQKEMAILSDDHLRAIRDQANRDV